MPQLPDEHEVFDVNAVRADFPILKETVNGKPLIWFDNAATTQKPQVGDRPAVVLLRARELQHSPRGARVGRPGHRCLRRGPRNRAAIHRRREGEQNVFVRGTTEAINLVAYAWGGKHLGPGDEIVITHLEHHANIVPWQLLSQKPGAV